MGKRDRNIRRTIYFHDYYARLKSIALSVYEWKGLPDTCDARFLEKTLFDLGRAVFVNDENMSFLTLKVNPTGNLNVYDIPVSYTAYGTGYTKQYSASECVLIRNNYLEKSTDSTIILYAERLARVEMAIQVNVNAQKTPILIECEDKTRKSLETVYDLYEGDSPVIFTSKSMQEKPLNVAKTDAPFVADKLRQEKRALWNEALEFLGLNTNPSDKKKERLIVSEVNSNNEEVEAQRDVMLLARQEACEAINKMFGLSVSVEKRIKDERGVQEWQNTQSNLEK